MIAELAKAENLTPFGSFVGATDSRFAEWPGVVVYGEVPIELGSGGELLHVRMNAREFPARCELLERHFAHTQVYLSANGKPWVMLMGNRTSDGLPDLTTLKAFIFRDGDGVVLHAGIWHEFPLAIEDNTRFTVVLRGEAHVNTLVAPSQPMDARGPDLERYDIAARAEVMVMLPSGAAM